MALSSYLGYGHDTVTPVRTPAGQASQWPASHQRITGGITLSQALSPRLVIYGGAATSFQAGTLSSPYRSAEVISTLFPEEMPSTRLRNTAFAQLSWYLGRRTALHARQGAYLDSWEVFALIPEVAVAKEIGRSGLLSVGYRLYKQWPSAFYQPVYTEIETYMTGDVRLGAIVDQTGTIDLRWRLVSSRAGPGALSATAGYSLSYLRYVQLGHALTSHTIGAGLLAVY